MGFSNIFNALADHPGNLVYHMVVGFSLLLANVLAVSQVIKNRNNKSAWQVVTGCSILLFYQVILIILFFSSLSPTAPHLAIIERLIAALTIIWLAWMLVETDRRYILTIGCIILSILLLLPSAVSLLMINQANLTGVTTTHTIDILWQSSALVLILIAIFMLLITRPGQYLVGLGILLILAAGHMIQITVAGVAFPLMGGVRLAQTIALPWVLALTARFTKEANDLVTSTRLSVADPTKSLGDSKISLVNLLLDLNRLEDFQEKCRKVAHALSLTLVADICFIVHLPEDNDDIRFTAGYDLIREVFFEPAVLDRDGLQHILDAWEKQQAISFDVDEESRDSITLANLIKYHRIGSLLAYPIATENRPLAGGILFLSPYTSKSWGDEVVNMLNGIGKSLGEVLFSPNPIKAIRSKLDQSLIKISRLENEIQSLKAALAEKEKWIQEQSHSIQQLKAGYQVEKLETIKKMEHLQHELRKAVDSTSSERDFSLNQEQLQNEIRLLSKERDQLKTLLSRANHRIRDLESQTGQTGPIRLSLENQITSLDSIAANIKMNAASGLQIKNITLQIINPDGRQMIKTDSELLQSALLGLVQNASQASNPGSTIKVDLQLSFETGMLIVEVTDHGVGLTPQEQKILFNAESNMVPGIGSISAIRDAIRAVRVLNGKIWLRSKKESFTTFKIQLPVRIID